jgi:hypothetical protein
VEQAVNPVTLLWWTIKDDLGLVIGGVVVLAAFLAIIIFSESDFP